MKNHEIFGGRHRPHATLLFAAAVLFVGCKTSEPNAPSPAPVTSPDVTETTDERKPFPSDDLGLRYASPANDSDSHPRDVCWLGGPHQVVALVELKSSFQTFTPDGDCSTTEPYVSSYHEADVSVVRAFPSPRLGFEEMLAPKFLEVSTPFPGWERKAGDLMLLSMREIDSEWFVSEYLLVELADPADPDSPATQSELPGTWSSLSRELALVRKDFSQSCTEPYQHGSAGTMLMDDATFDTWAHTRTVPEDCGSSNDAPPADDPSDGEVNDLAGD